nr:hypothetical protein [Alkalihalobacillus hemicentroti]
MLDSCGTSGTGETPQERKRRGGSPPAPRKASILERKFTYYSNNVYEKSNYGKILMKQCNSKRRNFFVHSNNSNRGSLC